MEKENYKARCYDTYCSVAMVLRLKENPLREGLNSVIRCQQRNLNMSVIPILKFKIKRD